MFELIFQDAPQNTYIEVTQLPSNRRYIAPDKINGALSQPGTDIYFAPALRKNPGTTREDVFGTRVLWADVDRSTQPYSTFPPSIVVHSGGGWHLYWLLNEWCTDVNTIEDANKALMEDVDGDHCWNANRLLRVPGTYNSKYPNVLCELRQLRPGITYDIGDFAALAKIDNKTRHKIRTGDRRGYKSRSERDWAIIESLVLANATDTLIRTVFLTQPCGDKFRDPDTNAEQYLQHTIDQVREKSRTVRVLRRTVGDIVDGDDGYYVDRARGRSRLSTFTFQPTLLLEGDKEDVLVGTIRSNNYEWKDVRLPRSAFNDRKSLDKHLTTAAWVWLGRDDDVRALLPFLLKQIQDKGLPRSKATSVLGRHDTMFVGNTQTVDASQLYDGVDSPLVFLQPHRELPKVNYTQGPVPDLKQLYDINKPSALHTVLGWYMATPFKPQLEARGIRFPILNLYGTRGSGKTSLTRTMQRLMGYAPTVSYDCNTTRFVVLTLLGSTNSIPVAFSEFRAAVAERFIRFVLLSYDTGHDPRGRADQTTVDYPLTAPFSVDGEDIINDAACKERILAVNLHPEDIAESTPQYKAFTTVRDLPLEQFALPYIQWCLSANLDDMLTVAKRDVFEAFPETLPDRVRNNMIVARAGQLGFQAFTTLGCLIPTREIFEPILRSVWSPELGRSITLADEFCEAIVNAVAMKRSDFYYMLEDGVLWFQLATAMAWWQRFRRMSGQNTLERDAVRAQLIERSTNLGDKGQYVVAPCAKDGRWLYGIHLEHAHTSGLDVPDKISERSMTVKF